MKNLIFSAFIVFLALSCDKKTTEVVMPEQSLDSLGIIPEANGPIEPSTLQTCYMEAVSKDSVFLTLDDNLGTITGKMRYKNFEKDSSLGDVMGHENADTLKLVYTFASEGVSSEREIYFLRKEGNLIEASGEYKVDGLKSVYADPSKLIYEGHPLKQVDCTDFDKKFKGK